MMDATRHFGSMTNALMAQTLATLSSLLGAVGETQTSLAILGDGAGRVDVPPDEAIEGGEVYVHVPMGQGRRVVFSAVNKAGVGREGQWVVVGRSPRSPRAVILDVDPMTMGQFALNEPAGTNVGAAVAPHQWKHHISHDDAVLIDEKQVINVGLAPYVEADGSSPGLRLQLNRGWYRYGRRMYYVPTGTRTGDLSAYLPGTPGAARWLMVCVHPETQVLEYVAGDEFTYDADDLDVDRHAPREVPARRMVVGFVLMLAGATGFAWAQVRAHPEWLGGGAGEIDAPSDFFDYVVTVDDPGDPDSQLTVTDGGGEPVWAIGA